MCLTNLDDSLNKNSCFSYFSKFCINVSKLFWPFFLAWGVQFFSYFKNNIIEKCAQQSKQARFSRKPVGQKAQCNHIVGHSSAKTVTSVNH